MKVYFVINSQQPHLSIFHKNWYFENSTCCLYLHNVYCVRNISFRLSSCLWKITKFIQTRMSKFAIVGSVHICRFGAHNNFSKKFLKKFRINTWSWNWNHYGKYAKMSTNKFMLGPVGLVIKTSSIYFKFTHAVSYFLQ